jgi:hypothetical protein
MRQQLRQLQVFADYHQFYLWDPAKRPEAPTDYTEEDVKRRIKADPYVVVIQPERNMTVPVEIEIHDTEPPFEAHEWDHIAEASLHLESGQLQVHQCTLGPVADLTAEPGWYRVRSFHAGLGTLSADGLDGNDRYRVVLWPAPPSDVRVMRQWAG